MSEGDIFKRFGDRGAGRMAPTSESTESTSDRLAVRHQPEQSAVREAELRAAVERVPALPDVVTQLLQVVDARSSSAADMEHLIERDMVISGRLLKLVNSPFFGLTSDITSITQAVALIEQ